MENTENNDMILELTDQDGKPRKFEFLDLIPYEGDEYIVLYPVDEEEDDGEVVILKTEGSEDGENESFSSVHDENVIDHVFEVFREHYKDEYDFVDDEAVIETKSAGPDGIIPYEGSEPFVFISYAHVDSERVLPMLKRICDDGYRVWYDEGIEAGAEWAKIIGSHLISSSCVITFLTENYLKSDNCLNEIELARNENKPIIIIHLDDIKLPVEFRLNYGRKNAVFCSQYGTGEKLYKRIYSSAVLRECRGSLK